MFSAAEEEIIYGLSERLTGSTQKGSSRKTVLIQNVARRMQSLGIASLTVYLKYAADHKAEYAQLISALTIHFTNFFRESEHFELVFQEAMESHKAQDRFRVLCAACSSGEEVYSLGLFLELKRQSAIIGDYEIFASDIDGVSVQFAQKAIYPIEKIPDIPVKYRQFCLLGSGKTKDLFTIHKDIRQRIEFKQADLRKIGSVWTNTEASFSAVFCRNVLIYFDAKTLDTIVSQLLEHVRPGGVLCLGHSETIDAARFKLEAKGRSVYKTHFVEKNLALGDNATRVLVVDDSLVIRKVVVSMLTKAGFATEAVDSAAKATKALREGRFDLVTLDLNMPEMDGATWLRGQRQAGMRIPVVIVSDSSAAAAEDVLGALASGAQDYIEKRELSESPQKLADRLKAIAAQHIRGRSNLHPKAPLIKRLDEFRRQRPDLILIGASTGGTEALVELLRMLPHNCPPVLVVQHITTAFAETFAKRLAKISGLKLASPTQDAPLESGCLYMAINDYHIGVKKGGGTGWKLDLSLAPAEHSVRPAIDVLFRSAAQAKVKGVAVILTGMGKDGALGLRDLKNTGSLTMAQDEQSCVVYGMPREAVELGAVHLVGDLKSLRQEIDQCITLVQAA